MLVGISGSGCGQYKTSLSSCSHQWAAAEGRTAQASKFTWLSADLLLGWELESILLPSPQNQLSFPLSLEVAVIPPKCLRPQRVYPQLLRTAAIFISASFTAKLDGLRLEKRVNGCLLFICEALVNQQPFPLSSLLEWSLRDQFSFRLNSNFYSTPGNSTKRTRV